MSLPCADASRLPWTMLPTMTLAGPTSETESPATRPRAYLAVSKPTQTLKTHLLFVRRAAAQDSPLTEAGRNRRLREPAAGQRERSSDIAIETRARARICRSSDQRFPISFYA